ncbi:MAG: FtsX-like permease family protein [Myxococcaceae bacterium]|nr:FtsX-like permease family protein [Myxococcaceae bacterium]
MVTKLRVLLQIAWRNLFASWLNVIIGLVILGGTFLVVVGGSALDSLDRSMSRSIIGSVSGDLQVYAASSKDKLSLFGQMGGGDADLTPIPSFARVKEVLMKVPNVRAVVPMGAANAIITSGNTVDVMLARLRDAQKRMQAGDASAKAEVDSLKAHVHHIVQVLKEDRKNADKLVDESAKDPRAEEAIERVSKDEFWAEFDQDPFGSLEYLENRIAPLLSDGQMAFLRYFGTDLDAFAQAFDRLQIVDGQMVPQGHRGMLLPKFFYEESFKLKHARRLDLIKEEIEENHATIAKNADLQRMVRENMTQPREILFQLDPLKTKEAAARLQKSLKTNETDLEKLLVQLFDTNDQNFQEHYRIFYSDLAPLLELYRLRIGDSIPIRTYSRSGYAHSANVKVWGTFNFKGLEKSPLAGVAAPMDLITFRELYGYMSPERRTELERIKQAAGAQDISREDAEAALFGGSGEDAAGTEGATTAIDEAALFDSGGAARAEETTFTQADIDNGIFINAAVMLKDPGALSQTIQDIQAASDANGLGLKVATWQEAAGIIGQFVQYLRYALYVIAIIIFLVAMLILSNAVLMATLQRVREIGTMRAIGAQRGFVRMMIAIETLALGTAFGGTGLALGAGLVALVGHSGIPAVSRQLYFFFGGPRWFPEVSVTNMVIAYGIVLVVSILSTLYPAMIATRVSPVVAMASDE